ncbi:unnamed protein product [Symbiodinium natans]|uniref:Uncharacterized protein n=1 Tax=Symbiodinium natans TaxID=878477 RepID=A0A812S5R3_9DINO|nr:unnamed protein product [Symbiodinium natans]
MERFLHRSRAGQVVDVDEFQVAKALLAGETRLLSQDVGSKHLFDWCLEYGKQSTALAMLFNGVPGCLVKGGHLTLTPPGFSYNAVGLGALPKARLPKQMKEPFSVADDCCCSGRRRTCPGCSWGFPDHAAVWMEDFDVSVENAKEAAERAAETPLARGLFEALRSKTLHLAKVDEKVMARLLDIALLLGDVELASSCVKSCTCFPLRRWRFRDFVAVLNDPLPGWRPRIGILQKEILIAALATGVALQHLSASYHFAGVRGSILLSEAMALSDAEPCQVQDLLPLLDLLGPGRVHKTGNAMALFLTEDLGGEVRLSHRKLCVATRAGLALNTFQAPFQRQCRSCHQCALDSLTLLDLAILLGQRDCARLCGFTDIGTTSWTPPLSLQNTVLVGMSPRCDACDGSLWRCADFWGQQIAPLSERRVAAGEALTAAVQASHRQAAKSAGAGLSQAAHLWSRGEGLPLPLLTSVLDFAAEQPALAEALRGRHAELLPR